MNRRTFLTTAAAAAGLAKKLVRQDWTRWDLDAVLPMLYHNFYNEDLALSSPDTGRLPQPARRRQHLHRFRRLRGSRRNTASMA